MVIKWTWVSSAANIGAMFLLVQLLQVAGSPYWWAPWAIVPFVALVNFVDGITR